MDEGVDDSDVAPSEFEELQGSISCYACAIHIHCICKYMHKDTVLNYVACATRSN